VYGRSDLANRKWIIVPIIFAGLLVSCGETPVSPEASSSSSIGTRNSSSSMVSNSGSSTSSANSSSAKTSSSSNLESSSSSLKLSSSIANISSSALNSSSSASNSSSSAWKPGNLESPCAVPSEAAAEDVSAPDRVVGNGTPQSCTGQAFIDAVAQGGVIVFNCGNAPHTIVLNKPAKIFNDANPKVVIDGGGKITLSGGGVTRILYMNTCDADQHWTTANCDNQDHPRLTVQNIAFRDGDSRKETQYDGGGAIWARGGRLKIVNSKFVNNTSVLEGADAGGGAVRAFDQYEDQPIYVVQSTFGGEAGLGNESSNGGAISSIGVSWTIINSEISYNKAVGRGGNPAEAGTPGGGSGGAIYNDGNRMSLKICGTRITNNQVNAYGSAIFFVSNDHSGDMRIEKSTLRNNTGGSWYSRYPGLSMHDDTPCEVVNSTIE